MSLRHKHDWYRNTSWTKGIGAGLLWDQCDGCDTIELLYVKRIGKGALSPDFERTWVELIWSRFTVKYVGAMAGKEPRDE